MKKAAILFTLIVFSSCQYFEKQVPDEDELLEKRLQEINWNEVSSYPSIPECDAILEKELRKQCFFEAMARIVQEKLDMDTIALLYPEIDTIAVKVTVSSDARLTFEPQFPQDSVSYDQTKIDSLIKNRLVDFPEIIPALKEGVPVTTQFILPVILNVEQ